ncbi:MAG: hypothetical protein QME32_02105 [Endomicrobiia bacterium]|nr:hypothetical protein [Endomicrobiia bacterium]
MAIEDILKYIDAETAAKRERLIAEARAKADAIESDAAKEKERIEKDRRRRLDIARRTSEERHLRRARMAARRAALAARREILDGLYANLFKKIASLEGAKIPLYEKLLESIPQSPTAEIITSASESAIWSKLKKHVKHSNSLEGNFAGGFIYKTAGASWDFTLENIFADFRTKTQSAVAAIIFTEALDLLAAPAVKDK